MTMDGSCKFIFLSLIRYIYFWQVWHQAHNLAKIRRWGDEVVWELMEVVWELMWTSSPLSIRDVTILLS